MKKSYDPVPKPAKKAKRARRYTPDAVLKRNREIVLERAQGCEACDLIATVVPGWRCALYPIHVHHRRRQGPGRTKGGGHMLANLRAVCFLAHDWIHHIDNKDTARSLGLLVYPEDPEFEKLGRSAA